MVPAMDLIETLLLNGSMIYSSMQRKIGCWLVILTSIDLYLIEIEMGVI
jgi:hypothetical protein